MRNLKKQLEKIYRKAALKLVTMGVVPEAAAAPPDQQQQQAAAAAAAAEGEAGAAGSSSSPSSENDGGSRAQQLAESAEGAAATALAEPLIVIDGGDLKEYVGQPPYPTDKIYAEGTPVGERQGGGGQRLPLAG